MNAVRHVSVKKFTKWARSSILISTTLIGLGLFFLNIWQFRAAVTVQADTPSFSEHRTFGSAIDCTYSLAVGDVDADGRIDIMSGNTRSYCDQEQPLDQQDIIAHNALVGRQSGFFPVEHMRSAGPADGDTLDTAMGDFNGDGALDLVVAAGYVQENILPQGKQNYILLNDGSGNFPSGTLNCTSPAAGVICFGDPNEVSLSVAVGDVNGDGRLDVVTSDVFIQLFPPAAQSEVKIFYNDDTNSFTNVQTVAAAVPNSWIGLELALAHLDTDNNLDIVVGNGAYNVSSLSIEGAQNHLFLQTTPGSFDIQTFGLANDITRGLALGDLDRNGFQDIIEGNGFSFIEGGVRYQARENRYYLNDGVTIDAGTVFGAATPTLDVAVGDLNHDGFLDIVAANFTTANEIYFNDGAGNLFEATPHHFGTGADGSISVETADLNGNGAIDIIVGNIGQNLIYLNEQAEDFLDEDVLFFGSGSDLSYDMTAADVVSQDGLLDLIVVNDDTSEIYANRGDGRFDFHALIPTSTTPVFTRTVAAADMNNDTYIDIIISNWGQPNEIYINDGFGQISETWTFDPSNSQTFDMGIADFNGDNRLDIVVSNLNQPNSLFLNQANNSFENQPLASNTTQTLGVAVGDIDNDGDTDIAIGNQDFNQKSILYLNNGAAQFPSTINCSESNPGYQCFGNFTDWIISLGLADVNGDDLLDIIMGNLGQQNRIYINQSGTFGQEVRLFGPGSDLAYRMKTADANGDGFTDIVMANGLLINRNSPEPIAEDNFVYYNDGSGNFLANHAILLGAATMTETANTSLGAAVADLDNNGTLDFAFANWEGPNTIFLNGRRIESNLSNNPPFVTVDAPSPSANTESAVASALIETIAVTVPFKVHDIEADDFGAVQFYYSQNGGDSWRPALPLSGTASLSYTTSPTGVTHTFVWDTFASGFFGQSDQVLLRVEIYPQPLADTPGAFSYPSQTPGPFVWPYASATTRPFRVRGTQIQVFTETTDDDAPQPDAVVLRLPTHNADMAELMKDANDNPLTTDDNGFLQGRGILEQGDQLIALYPVSSTQRYDVYYTSGTPNENGVQMDTIAAPGVQKLTVSPDNALVLFNLSVSLEWDARNDPSFVAQLKADIQRASQILYDVTNGQAALGNVNIYHDKGYWGHADIVIRANNSQRPGAALGGVVLTPTLDQGINDLNIGVTEVMTAYIPGQISMGPTWNRFGNPSGILGEDWPRTLAHELGHYLLFMPDNYLGIAEINGEHFLDIINCPGSMMTDPYLESYSEALAEFEWVGSCQNTLAERYLGRSDWETITKYYPFLKAPQDAASTLAGPGRLPLAVTNIQDVGPMTPTDTLIDPFFNLKDENGQPLSVLQGQGEAYLIKTSNNSDPTDDYVISLGTPIGDKVHARGAAPGDYLCVFDFSSARDESDAFIRSGCEEISTSGSLSLQPVENWQPDIQVNGVNSNTVMLHVENAPSDSDLAAQVLPALGAASEVVDMNLAAASPGPGTRFTQTITAPDGAYFGFVRIWDKTNPDREMISEYLLVDDWGGKQYSWGTPLDPWQNPGGAWGGKQYSWGGKAYSWGGKQYSWGAPIMSSDGQVSIFPLVNLFGQQQDYTLQRLDIPPRLDSWLTPVGQAYRIDREGGDLQDSAILFRYLARDVPAGYESPEFLSVYYYDFQNEAAGWQELDSLVNTEINHVSAKVAGKGLYILAATVELTYLEEGWNQIAYSVFVTPTLSVEEALLSIDGKYSSVYHCDQSQGEWRLFDAGVSTPFPSLVNELTEMEYGHVYWIYAKEAGPLYLGVRPKASLSVETTAVSACHHPPATYYGSLAADNGVTPSAGDTLTAEINGQVCGQTNLVDYNGGVAYVIQVRAKNIQDRADRCGGVGKIIQFKLNGVPIPESSIPWDNSQARSHPLNSAPPPQNYLYLPLITR